MHGKARTRQRLFAYFSHLIITARPRPLVVAHWKHFVASLFKPNQPHWMGRPTDIDIITTLYLSLYKIRNTKYKSPVNFTFSLTHPGSPLTHSHELTYQITQHTAGCVRAPLPTSHYSQISAHTHYTYHPLFLYSRSECPRGT